MKLLKYTTIILLLCGCTQTKDPFDTKKEVSFQQTLLKEALPYLSRQWNIPMAVLDDLATKKDLWINYHPGTPVSLHTALQDIRDFIKSEHGVTIVWHIEKDYILFSTENKQNKAVDTFSEYFDSPPVPSPHGDDMLLYSLSDDDITLDVSIHDSESLVSITLKYSNYDLPVFTTLQRKISECVIRSEKNPPFLWFRSASNAVFISKAPINVQIKG